MSRFTLLYFLIGLRRTDDDEYVSGEFIVSGNGTGIWPGIRTVGAIGVSTGWGWLCIIFGTGFASWKIG